MLEVIGAGNPEYKGQDWADVWENSKESKHLSDEISQIVDSRKGQKDDDKDKAEDREFAMSVWEQVVTVTKRSFVAYWRTPEYLLV